MIQRIQSIFLAVAALCTFGLLGTDVAETEAPVPASVVFADAHFTVFDSPLLLGGVALSGVLLLVTIFLFRNRSLQVKLTYGAIVLLGAYVGLGFMMWYDDQVASTSEVEPGIALPILAFVFAILAIVYIRKDDQLVRSADRLR